MHISLSRPERIAVTVAAALVVAFVGVLGFGLADRLNRLSWFGSGANLIQWASGIAFAATVVTWATMHVVRSCAARPWCLRHGDHQVTGTLKKVCSHHHTAAHHVDVVARHGAAHTASGRLCWGESHGEGPE